MCAKVLQLCLTLYDPMDYSPSGSSIHGILQARKLEWVAMPSPWGGLQSVKILNLYVAHLKLVYICDSILISRLWINFTIIIRNSLSGRFPISSSFVWFGGHLSYSFTCWVFLCLFILFILLSLGCPFCILAVCGVLFIVAFPRCVWVCTGGLSRFPG